MRKRKPQGGVHIHIHRFPRSLWLRLKRKALRDSSTLTDLIAYYVRRGLANDAASVTSNPAQAEWTPDESEETRRP